MRKLGEGYFVQTGLWKAQCRPSSPFVSGPDQLGSYTAGGPAMTDRELLTRYLEGHDREALGTLIGRYMAMVHSSACGSAAMCIWRRM